VTFQRGRSWVERRYLQHEAIPSQAQHSGLDLGCALAWSRSYPRSTAAASLRGRGATAEYAIHSDAGEARCPGNAGDWFPLVL
jgi:hypothetical protein